jgi:hypothetical protein
MKQEQMETYKGGLASSALALRRGLALEQSAGFYLTNQRLIITRERVEANLGWQMNGGALFGLVVEEVNTYLNRAPRSIEEIDAADKLLDVPVADVDEVYMKAPGNFFGGHFLFKLRSGRSFKLSVVDRTEHYSEESFNAVKNLLIANPILRSKLR